MSVQHFHSWGIPNETHKLVIEPVWGKSQISYTDQNKYLAYGCGRSYGDICQNTNNTLIHTKSLNHFIDFDIDKGILCCEAGVTLDAILKIIVKQGWFLPVTPGTRYVTIGGAIANDVHGKNHHSAGTIGCFILSFELYRSNGSRLQCSAAENIEFFNASIGGLGLTGLITRVEIQLKKISTAFICSRKKIFTGLKMYFEYETENTSEYSVAWIDSIASGKKLGRGIYYLGNHTNNHSPITIKQTKTKSVPFFLPNSTLNSATVSLFNRYFYFKESLSTTNTIMNYQKYFYPLDNINHWNRIYGRQGFFQHQCVVPIESACDSLTEILKIVSKNGSASFLSVLKKFGDIKSPGLLSFPRPGYTLALDFPNKGTKTLKMLQSLNDVVESTGGAIYPAKDACMSSTMFHKSFPKLDEFVACIDPVFSSSFWRRVMP